MIALCAHSVWARAGSVDGVADGAFSLCIGDRSGELVPLRWGGYHELPPPHRASLAICIFQQGGFMPQLIASVEGVEIKHVYLKNDRTTLGRKPHNDIVFDNMVVSGDHCVFELKGIADVYVKDLGSTNGTYINGHMIKSPQQLEDGDLIAIGKFRLLFRVASAHEPFGFQSETSAMPLEALGFPGSSGALQASLKILSGSSAGLEVPVVKAVTTFGQPGVSVVSISHRPSGYYVAHMKGGIPSTLNGQAIGPEAIALAHRDVLNLAGTEMEFFLKDR